MHREYAVGLLAIAAVISAVTAAWLTRDLRVLSLVGVGFTAVGSFLVAFGFWGADYAFSVRLGELDQSRQAGHVKGEAGKVYVPFVRNYTPTEWWNLNWFLITLGLFLTVAGTYHLGLLHGRLGL